MQRLWWIFIITFIIVVNCIRQELSMMLLDSDFELRKVVVKHIQGLVSTYTHNGDSGCCRFCPQANDSDAQVRVVHFKLGVSKQRSFRDVASVL